MYGIPVSILNNSRKLKNILAGALKKDNFIIVNEASHEFNPRGISIVILLAESHASIHTYPEYNSLHFNFYSCRGRGDCKKTFELFKKTLNPSSIDFKERDVIVDKSFISN
jgi:S-adenosylmethionine decarboxylase